MAYLKIWVIYMCYLGQNLSVRDLGHLFKQELV